MAKKENGHIHYAREDGERKEMSNCYKKNYFSKKCFDCDNKMICRDKVYDDLLKQFEEKEREEEKHIDYGGEKPWVNIDATSKIDLEDSLLEEPPTYVDDRNISLEQSERKRLFSSGETFDIVIGKKEKEEK